MADQEQDNEPHSFHTEEGAVIFDKPLSAAEKGRQKREDEQHEFARQQVITNKRLAWFTGALVFATFCTIVVGIWQGSVSQKSANAAKVAGETAQSSLTQSIESFRTDERAWVVIGKIEKTSTFPPDPPFDLALRTRLS
ncbi:MAG TPA: hypothetical protein VIJ79_15590 [Acidobacteriaceae bacterium]